MGKGEEIHDGEEWVDEEGEELLVFPRTGTGLYFAALPLRSRLLSLFNDVTRSFFFFIFFLPSSPHLLAWPSPSSLHTPPSPLFSRLA